MTNFQLENPIFKITPDSKNGMISLSTSASRRSLQGCDTELLVFVRPVIARERSCLRSEQACATRAEVLELKSGDVPYRLQPLTVIPVQIAGLPVNFIFHFKLTYEFSARF
jgi:hypothetical protein